jgi:hypothetical protein
MLARSFKTADELGITEVQHLALIQVLGALERGELHAYPDEGVKPIAESNDPMTFSMRSWQTCICGWANKFQDGAFGGNEGNNGRMSKLFCQTSLHMDQATAASHAI